MKNLKKTLALLLCAVLLVAGSVAGTLAYLTSNDTVVNTFTVGDVQIYLDEKDVDGSNTAPEAGVTGRDKANDYHLLPGHEYDKDPTVTVKAGSEESYIRMLVTINKQAELDAIFTAINAERAAKTPAQTPLTIDDVLTGFDNTKWIPYAETENPDNTRTYEFRYYQTVSTVGGTDEPLEPLFTQIVMPDEITNAQLKTLYTAGATNNLKIEVVAHAIQADGFANADAAWTAFNAA